MADVQFLGRGGANLLFGQFLNKKTRESEQRGRDAPNPPMETLVRTTIPGLSVTYFVEVVCQYIV